MTDIENKENQILNLENVYKSTTTNNLLIEFMYEFQKKKKPTIQYGFSAINTKLWLDYMKIEYPTARAKAIILFNNNEKKIIMAIVILIGDSFIDPTYNVNPMENRSYFENYHDFINNGIEKRPETKENQEKIRKKSKQLLEQYLICLEVEKYVNENEGDGFFQNDERYIKQKEFIDNKFSMLKNKALIIFN